MIGKFYGLTGVNLVLSSVSFARFKSLVSAMDSSANRYSLSVLKKELSEILTFLEKFPVVYEDRELNKIQSKLRRAKKERDQDGLFDDERDSEIKEWEEILANNEDKKTISFMARGANGNVELSEGARRIIEKLSSRTNLINDYFKNLEYSTEESGITVFGRPLYLLRNRSRAYLNNWLYDIYGTELNKGSVSSLKNDLNILLDRCKDGVSTQSRSKLLSRTDDVKDSVVCMNSEYFDRLLEFDEPMSEEYYYNVSLELMNLGLFGFNIYSREFFEEFKSNTSFDNNSDLFIYSEAHESMHNLVQDLEESLESYVKVKEG